MRDFSTFVHRIRALGAQPGRVLAATSALLLACGPRPADIDGSAGTGSAEGGSAEGGSGSTAPTSGGVTGEPAPVSTGGDSVPDTSGMTSDEAPCNFICSDEPPKPGACPALQQLEPECPEGHKCTTDGGVEAAHCVEIAPDPKGLYETCTAQGDWLSGFDDCGLGMVCWGVDERGQGICIGMYDEGHGCADPTATEIWCQSCYVILCIPACDPLHQDCPNPKDACYPINDGFSCAPDASGDAGQFGDPCEFINVCDAGLACLAAEFVGASCAPGSYGCCSPYCPFPGGACPGPDQQCVQWHDPTQLPEQHPGLGIGVCGVPD